MNFSIFIPQNVKFETFEEELQNFPFYTSDLVILIQNLKLSTFIIFFKIKQVAHFEK